MAKFESIPQIALRPPWDEYHGGGLDAPTVNNGTASVAIPAASNNGFSGVYLDSPYDASANGDTLFDYLFTYPAVRTRAVIIVDTGSAFSDTLRCNLTYDPGNGAQANLVAGGADSYSPYGGVPVRVRAERTATGGMRAGFQDANGVWTWTPERSASGFNFTDCRARCEVAPAGLEAGTPSTMAFRLNSTVVNPLPVVTPEAPTIAVGDTVQLTADKPGSWASNDTSKATVSNAGLVTGIGAGTAIITFTAQDGSGTDTSTVTVNAVPIVADALRFVANTVPDPIPLGVVINPPIQVEAIDTDAGGVRDTAFTGAVTLGVDISMPQGARILRGTLTRNAVAGVASFDDLVFVASGSGGWLRLVEQVQRRRRTDKFDNVSVAPRDPAPSSEIAEFRLEDGEYVRVTRTPKR